MSYILRNNVNYYRPSDSLNNLFEELIRQPFKDHPPTVAWETEVKDNDREYRRKTILEQGRTDFDTSFKGLTPADKVLLYCIYYMPMHLYSSYHIYTKHLLPDIPENVVLIDIGCGPLTSGIAFWAAASQYNITYIGIDRSIAKLNKASEINNQSNTEIRKPFFCNFHTISDYNQLPYYLFSNVETGDTDDTFITFNLCYVLASHTFDDSENLDSLIGVFNRIARVYGSYKICVVYQNPPGIRWQKNWHTFKSGVVKYSDMFDGSNLSDQSSTKIEQLVYEPLYEKTNPRLIKVSYDSFGNFTYLEDYSDM